MESPTGNIRAIKAIEKHVYAISLYIAFTIQCKLFRKLVTFCYQHTIFTKKKKKTKGINISLRNLRRKSG
jgi:hypothetical protein